jgi:Xaa-Pro aminopeptidase
MINRLEKLRQKIKENDLDLLIVSNAANLFYLSGFNSSEAYLFITPNENVLATDFRYIEQAKEQSPGWEIYKIEGGLTKWLTPLLGRLKAERIGLEAESTNLLFFNHLDSLLKEQFPQAVIIPTENIVGSLRIVKDQEEISAITRAAAISDAAMEYISEFIQPGMTEEKVAWEIEKFMRENGSQHLPFDVIVASGPNAALPHAQGGARAIKSGEPIIIDIGAKVDGYASDLTRTLYMGKKDDTFEKIYGIVLEAQLAAINGITNGMPADQADSIARDIISRAGFGEAFGHSLGHGIGLEIHEAPNLSPNSKNILTDNMVFTIEPGIYLPGWGGVRIEDSVMLEGKIRCLSKVKK